MSQPNNNVHNDNADLPDSANNNDNAGLSDGDINNDAASFPGGDDSRNDDAAGFPDKVNNIDSADDIERFEAVTEAILFASGEPLTLERISLIIDRPVTEVKTLLDRMQDRFRKSKRGLLLRELSGKYQLCTRPELSPYVSKLFEIRQKQSLSQAAYETLAIIAYNANVTRAIIEKIRGVNSDSSIAKLLERNLIMETGRASLPGRPMRYDVTDDFYRLFGFKSRADLPNIEDRESADDDISI